MEYMRILETPGGALYLKRAMSALAAGWNVVLVLPDTVRNPAFLDAARKSLRVLGGPAVTVADASRTPSAEGLSPVMASLPGADKRKKRKPIADVFRPSECDFMKVTAYTGLESLSEAAQQTAARELALASEASSEGPGGGEGREGMRFMALIRPGFPPVPEARGLKAFPWWGAASRADFDLLFEQAASECDATLSEADYWWLKALAAGVGGDDPGLIGAMVEQEPRDVESVRRILAAHPLARLMPQDFEFEGALLYPGISPSRSAPPDRGPDLELWAAGLISPNRYSLYHPALLSRGGPLLDRFVSRGQRDVLFPLVDQVHGAIVHILEAELGTGLWDHYIPDQFMRDAALREMGPLFKAMKDFIRPQQSSQRFFVKDLSDLAERWKLIRHLAAHSQVLDYRSWVKAVDLYRRSRERLFSDQPAGGPAYANGNGSGNGYGRLRAY
ncbi:MAG: hypothetical protein LBT40_09720 [Deltaproteobacteria bacterium]|jgi:hypothetical protein|nr:hypothetical protein [Deltaproteobacteria bacterium]